MSKAIIKIQNKAKLTKVTRQANTKCVTKPLVNKVKFIHAVYLIEGNDKLSVPETCYFAKRVFGVTITPQNVYAYRQSMRRKGNMLPFDSSANLTEKGMRHARANANGLN